MGAKARHPRFAAGVSALLLVCAAIDAGGCLGKPKIEDRWTRIDVRSSNLAENQAITPGVRKSIQVGSQITYRSIITGYLVCDLRASSTIGPTDVAIGLDAPRQRMAEDIDRLLVNSTCVGRATRAVTGWDHLIQGIDLSFSGVAPATDSSGAAIRGLFLVCYLAQGDKIELANGMDSLVITPYRSTDYEYLSIGMKLAVAP